MKRENSRFSIDQINKVIANWEQYAKENGGRVEVRKRVYSDRSELEKITNYKRRDVLYTSLYFFDIYIPYRSANIKISTSEVKTPIIQFYFPGKKTFSFSIRYEDFVDKISKFFGQKELQIEHEKFDSKFFIESTDSELLKEYLDKKMIDWLEQTPIAYFDYNSLKSKDTLSLYCTIDETDLNEIDHTIKMFTYCVDKLMESNFKNK